MPPTQGKEQLEGCRGTTDGCAFQILDWVSLDSQNVTSILNKKNDELSQVLLRNSVFFFSSLCRVENYNVTDHLTTPEIDSSASCIHAIMPHIADGPPSRIFSIFLLCHFENICSMEHSSNQNDPIRLSDSVTFVLRFTQKSTLFHSLQMGLPDGVLHF